MLSRRAGLSATARLCFILPTRASLCSIIIINEVQLTWRKVAKLQGHVTKKSHVECLGPKERRKSSDFSRRRNTCRDVDARTSSGRLFQTAGAAATKARSPIVERCVRRPTSAEVVAERSRCRELTSETRSRSADRYRLAPCHGGSMLQSKAGCDVTSSYVMEILEFWSDCGRARCFFYQSLSRMSWFLYVLR